MKWAGIDPGIKGGIGIIGGDTFTVTPMPESAKDIIKLVEGSKHVFLEKCQAFPGQGISSARQYRSSR